MDKIKDFGLLMKVYSSIQPVRAPDFTKGLVVEYWFNEFGSIPLDKLRAAIDIWIRNEPFFPCIAELRKTLGLNDLDPDLEARQVVANIIDAIRKFGYQREKEAREFLGPLTWSVILGSGGYQNLCEMTYQNQTVICAQMRELARSMLTSRRFPINEQNRQALQQGSKAAINIAESSCRTIDQKTAQKRIGNTTRRP